MVIESGQRGTEQDESVETGRRQIAQLRDLINPLEEELANLRAQVQNDEVQSETGSENIDYDLDRKNLYVFDNQLKFL